MEQDKLDALVNKIQKLLNLAGNNPNENEAAAAMEAASRLMAVHNLTLMDVDTTKDEERIEEKFAEKGGTKAGWARRIWNSTCSLNFCKYFYTSVPRSSDIHHIIGTRANVTATMVMADYLVTTVNRLAFEAIIKGTERQAFRLGAATRLSQRLFQLKKDRERGTNNKGSINPENLPALANLYAVHQTDNDAYYAQNYTKGLKTGKQTTTKNTSAYYAGMKAANDISLSDQIDKQNRQAIR